MKKDRRSEFWSNLLIVSLKIFLFFFLLTLPVSTILRSWQRCQKYLPLQKIAIYFLMCSTLIQLYFCCKWHHKTLREEEGKVFYFSAWSFLQNVSFFFFSGKSCVSWTQNVHWGSTTTCRLPNQKIRCSSHIATLLCYFIETTIFSQLV